MRLKLTALALALVSLLAMATPAFAVEAVPVAGAAPTATDAARGYRGIGAGIGAGFAIIGAGLGIGLIGFAALSGIARQPEAAGKIQVNMIVMAALIEGAAIIALLVICYALVS